MTTTELEILKWSPLILYVMVGTSLFLKFLGKVTRPSTKEITAKKQLIVIAVCGPGAWLITLLVLLGHFINSIVPAFHVMSEKIEEYLFTEKKE